MSERNGRHGATVMGLAALVIVGAAPIQEKHQPNIAAHEGQTSTAPNPEGNQRLTRAERESIAVDRAANRIAERANLIADAQRSYAFWQLVFAAAGVIFTAIAAVAAIAAAKYAKHAAQAAKQSADADNAALTETRRIAATQLRPYVYLVDEQFGRAVLSGGGLKEGEITFAFKNFGQTPAKRVRFRAEVRVQEGPWNMDFPADLSKIHELQFGDLPPGHTRPMVEGYPVFGLEPYRLAFEGDTAAIVLHGEVVYGDANGVEYRTAFRRSVNGKINSTHLPIFHVPPYGNDAT